MFEYAKESVEQRVIRVVIEHLGVNESKVTSDADFENDLCADSLDIVELTMAFEEAFDIEISEDAAEKVRTVGDVINKITLLKAEKDVDNLNSTPDLPNEIKPKRTTKSKTAGMVSFEACPAGMFKWGNLLCLKTIHKNNLGVHDAYIATGEYFWGGTKTLSARNKVLVTPVFYPSLKGY